MDAEDRMRAVRFFEVRYHEAEREQNDREAVYYLEAILALAKSIPKLIDAEIGKIVDKTDSRYQEWDRYHTERMDNDPIFRFFKEARHITVHARTVKTDKKVGIVAAYPGELDFKPTIKLKKVDGKIEGSLHHPTDDSITVPGEVHITPKLYFVDPIGKPWSEEVTTKAIRVLLSHWLRELDIVLSEAKQWMKDPKGKIGRHTK